MNCSQNKIINTTLPTEAGHQLNDVVHKQCRICLQADSGQYIQPCQCSGTLQYVHFKCMAQWIRHSNPRQFGKKQESYEHVCEMCKDTVMFQCQQRYACTGKKELINTIHARFEMFIGLIVVTIICLGLFIGGIIMTDKQEITDKSSSLTFIILMACTIVMGILVLILLYVWITDYIITIERYVSKIPNFSRRSVINSMTVQIPRVEPDAPQQRMVNSRSMGSRLTTFPQFFISNIE